jgi:S-DNA-T family DNA segregation ATPase FtsK/SpoIIIE
MPPRKPVRSNIPPKEETKTIPLNAGTPKKKDPRTNTGNQKSIWRQIADFFGNESMHFILGIIVTLLLVYVTVGMISYFSTGAEDQSKMELSWSELHGVREDIQNITSVSGALLSHNLIHQGFGIASFAIIFFLFIAALRLMQVKFLSVL